MPATTMTLETDRFGQKRFCWPRSAPSAFKSAAFRRIQKTRLSFRLVDAQALIQ